MSYGYIHPDMYYENNKCMICESHYQTDPYQIRLMPMIVLKEFINNTPKFNRKYHGFCYHCKNQINNKDRVIHHFKRNIKLWTEFKLYKFS